MSVLCVCVLSSQYCIERACVGSYIIGEVTVLLGGLRECAILCLALDLFYVTIATIPLGDYSLSKSPCTHQVSFVQDIM